MIQHTPLRVRFAPSPTGHVHLGSARTALYNYLIARQSGGQFILRIEDTDRKRYVEGAEQELLDSLRWLGIDWDEGPEKGGPYGPYRQSERKEIYQQYAQELIQRGGAYYCFCSPERLAEVRQVKQKGKLPPHYDGLCRNLSLEEAQARAQAGEAHVIRFKTPKQGSTVVRDMLRGEIIFDNATLDDFILVKSDGWALYHLAAIVDDYLMKITHVIRGSEWLSTSPLHSMIWKAFAWQEPEWVHLSVFLKPSGKGKMSKREAAELSNDGYSIFIKDMEQLGYLPAAVVNWVALMGWSYDDHTEFFTMADLVEKFSLRKLNPSPAAINFSKLDHFNKEHIKHLTDEQLAKLISPFLEKNGFTVSMEQLTMIAPVIKERITTLDDAVETCAFLFKEEISYEREFLVIKGKTAQETLAIGKQVLELIKTVDSWDVESLEKPLTDFMEKEGLTFKELYSFLREAVFGQRVTPPLFESMQVFGKVKTTQRVEWALRVLAGY